MKALVTHHPLSSPIDAAPVALAGRSTLALEAIVSLRVHLLLSGHHHRSTSGAPAEIETGGSILVVHAGTATSTRTRGGEANSYNLLAIEQGRLTLGILAWSVEDGFMEQARATYSYNEHSWRREPLL
jgi:3',5'-cyclic AMP phosphodiesterase CpdA